ncbi:MAG: nucleoside recognition domain-containing protein [Bacilli bacterium]
MNKKISSVVILIVVLFISFQILSDSKDILEAVSFSFNIWKDNIFPALFPFFVISELLINYGFIEFLGELLRPLMNKLFKLKGETGFVLAMSMVSGFPSSAKYTKSLLEEDIINDKEGTKLLTFTHFSNPLFILGTISILFLNNKEIGYLILFSHFITNFIIGIVFRNYYISENKKRKVSIRRALSLMHHKRISNDKNFGEIFTIALNKSINTLLLILGIVTMFLVLTTIINNNVHVDNYNQSIINGVFEMTQGLKYMSLLEIPLKNKTILSTFFISLGGLSVHMQVFSIISGTKIKYLPFLIARLLHASIASLIVYLLFDYFIANF